jgi:hypothetical protein
VSEVINLTDVISIRGIRFMCDKKPSSIVHSQQAPVERVAEFITTAERELAAFYEAILSGWPVD